MDCPSKAFAWKCVRGNALRTAAVQFTPEEVSGMYATTSIVADMLSDCSRWSLGGSALVKGGVVGWSSSTVITQNCSRFRHVMDGLLAFCSTFLAG